jgi:hypothetical protein
MSDPRPISEDQLVYVRNIARRLHLPERMLDDHCVKRFKRKLGALSMADGSQLLEEMIAWEGLPADFARAKGQQDLF